MTVPQFLLGTAALFAVRSPPRHRSRHRSRSRSRSRSRRSGAQPHAPAPRHASAL